ncbi:NfeD family protein [Pseudorhodoplanes sp.]|uniref:NfeD family protein n=1 Tax=Pseudorhodoplanes sp. TaxID=1934341 RepID=UPI00391DACA1
MRRFGVAILSVLIGVAALAGATGPAKAATKPVVYVVEIDGAVSVAAQRQLSRAIERAKRDNAAAVVIRLDTPGGLVSATRDVIRDMMASPVPVLVLVGPSGARAASAGTFLVYASHLAAMTPGTNLGAATPVSMGGLPGTPQPKKDETPKEPGAAEKKAINDTVALLRSLAQMRDRNADFAEKAVREAATMTASEAQKAGVVEFVARDVADFLSQADGRSITAAGETRTLATRGATIEVLQPEWRTRLLATIADPNVAFILLLIGVYGLLFEFWNPGTFVSGIVGGISLLLAMIALSLLPVHYGALALLLLGIALMIAEVFTPGIGVLGIGGLVAFLTGAFFLFEGEGADFDMRVSLPVIAGAGLACAGLSFFVIGAAIKARNRPPETGAEQLLREQGIVVHWSGESGNIRIHGEIWAARAAQCLAPGTRVRVVKRDGLELVVEPVERLEA